ncbi:site-specific DNA-methyltransferase [Pontibacter litorisediminis]|uniref:site-specific DNA-methyltransferase n=1 Tax=Pontibacter litorisediminis TaxID=1846260 RepID=UPI0023EBCF88|nr:site-specific DNA-methyltransferase [Pontibacter litorisediminis]
MSDKLDLATPDLVQRNIEKIAALFPHCVTETATGVAIDFDLLKQELSAEIVEGAKERYRLEWPGKREAIVTANLPSTKTLRPIVADSVDFETTENIYIEGDNLEVLKLLQESYLGQIKLIYIDPPYNTGKDFVYKDNFRQGAGEYALESGQTDDHNQRLFANPETAGRYHSDWLTMIYPRLKLARNLLRANGAIFISIDENELSNLRKVCDEIFGESNFRNAFIARRHDKNLNRQFMNAGLKTFNVGFEYIVCYAKSPEFSFKPVFKESSEERQTAGYWKGFWNDADRPTMRYDILGHTPETGQWKWKEETALEAVANYQTYLEHYQEKMTLEEYWAATGKQLKFIRRNPDGKGKNKGVENWIAPSEGILRNTNWLDILASRSDASSQGLFDYPKNIELLSTIIQSSCEADDTVLDFFSGSASTAHAVMVENAEGRGSLKYIMVQLPELTDEKSEAYVAGYHNICEIGKERIRRAARKVKEETGADIDYGFRVYRLDSSNMQDVYYRPQDYQQSILDLFADNIKPDRTAADLLAQVILDWGLPLSLRIEQVAVAGKQVFRVGGNLLHACFDKGLDEEFAKALAQEAPQRIVFRDAGFRSDTAKINVKHLLKQLSPETEMKVI